MNDSVDGAEALDPRVQIELERLNTATDEINRLEVELDEARLVFRRLLAEGHLRIQQLTKKLGTSVHKARPYYEARFRANITSQELQAANVVYDKANSAHAAAREMVFLAEQGLSRLAEGSEGGVTLDPAWQEMLNHATARVNQAESDRAQATVVQRMRAATHRAAATLVTQLQANLKRHIAKSRPYFEEKARINTALDCQKARIQTLEQQVGDAKQKYSAALRNLEKISEDIHRHRSRRQSCRNGDVPHPKLEEDDNTTDEQFSEICEEESRRSVAAWLNNVDEAGCWTDVDLASSPEEVSFEKCSLRPHSASDKSSPTLPPTSPHSPSLPKLPNSKVSTLSPRRIIRPDRSASLKAELEKGRRPSLDALLHDTGEKVKEMFQGLSLFGERRNSECSRRAPSPRTDASSVSDERLSDTDSLHSVEMLTDDQIASLMLDAQLEASVERLAGVGVKEQNGHVRY